jgi:hypothetical protein
MGTGAPYVGLGGGEAIVTSKTVIGALPGVVVAGIGAGLIVHGAGNVCQGGEGVLDSGSYIFNSIFGWGRGGSKGRSIAYGHGSDHLPEFGAIGIYTEDELADYIDEIIQFHDYEKKLSQGRKAYWRFDAGDDQDGTVVILDPRHPDGGTVFRPAAGIDYFWRLK